MERANCRGCGSRPDDEHADWCGDEEGRKHMERLSLEIEDGHAYDPEPTHSEPAQNDFRDWLDDLTDDRNEPC